MYNGYIHWETTSITSIGRLQWEMDHIRSPCLVQNWRPAHDDERKTGIDRSRTICSPEHLALPVPSCFAQSVSRSCPPFLARALPPTLVSSHFVC